MHVYKPRGELTMKEKGTCSFYPSLEVYKNPSIQYHGKYQANEISLQHHFFIEVFVFSDK